MIFCESFPRCFYNSDSLRRYQSAALNYLKKRAGSLCNDVVVLRTSGTTGMIKTHTYSLPQFTNIDKYHFKKMCRLNDLNPALRAVWLLADLGDKDINVIGPSVCTNLGNDVYRVYVPFNANRQQWESVYRIIARLRPGLVYATPSTFMTSVYSLGNDIPNLSCPVLFSYETLFEDTRCRAMKTYTSVIDKMRAWDSGLSFTECKYGTKHIDDELCLVKQNDRNEIYSIDLFNYSKYFTVCKTDDLGEIQVKKCQCGIYGNTFSRFIGKSIQCLWDREGRACDPHAIIGLISSFIKINGDVYVPYLLRQEKDGTVVVFTDLEHEAALVVKNVLTGLLHQPIRLERYKEASHHGSKLLFIASEFSSMLQKMV